MIIYLFIFLLSFQRIATEYCPKTDEFILSSDKKCYKLYEGKKGFNNIYQSCINNDGILSGFINSTETQNVSKFIDEYYEDLNKTYLDRGFTCHKKNESCTMNRDINEVILNNITFLTDTFPCRGVMNIKNFTLYCIDMSLENDIIYVCQKDPLYEKNCTNYEGYKKYIDGNCYKLLEEFNFTKKTAEGMCEDNLGKLPIVTNYFENFVMNQLLNEYKSQFWLDFSCQTTNVSSCKWSTGKEISYANIENLNNNNSCGYIKKSDIWETHSCSKKKKVICQIRNE